MPTATETTLPLAYQAEQRKLQRETVAQLTILWKYLDPKDLPGSTDRWIQLVYRLILENRKRSENIALRGYNHLRTLIKPDAPAFQLAALARADSEKIISRLLQTGPYRIQGLMAQHRGGSNLSPKKAMNLAFTLHASVATDEVLEGGRRLTGEAIHQDRLAIGYARIPKPNACAFCVMLASRGAVYSKDTVLRTTGRARFGAGKAYHTSCGCHMMPVFSRHQDVPDPVEAATQEWSKLTQGVPGRDALKVFRAASGRR